MWETWTLAAGAHTRLDVTVLIWFHTHIRGHTHTYTLSLSCSLSHTLSPFSSSATTDSLIPLCSGISHFSRRWNHSWHVLKGREMKYHSHLFRKSHSNTLPVETMVIKMMMAVLMMIISITLSICPSHSDQIWWLWFVVFVMDCTVNSHSSVCWCSYNPWPLFSPI